MKLKTYIPFWFLALSAFAACGEIASRQDAGGPESSDDQAPQNVNVQVAALGEPLGDYPSYDERVLLYLTNRLRAEPVAFNPDSPFPPTPPLRYDVGLGHAARFHATHIQEADCWCEDHSSCCELEAVTDGAQCGGPVTGCGATDTATRVQMFSPAYSGENMARGQMSPAAAIDGWTFSPGHWTNINNAGHRLLGTGGFNNAWVQDFGSGGNPPIIGDGIHFSNGQSTTFGASYYQAGGGPRAALAIIDGECHDLEVAYGTAEHGAFEVSVALEPGCHRYYFHFTDSNGNELTYPSTGSLGASVGGTECPLFLEERPADTCSPSGQSCETGDTRACYTGPFGTRDVGACSTGAERCVAGQWTGECRGEVLPTVELCGDDLDDDCDDEVDEDCPSTEDVGPDADEQILAPKGKDSSGCNAAHGQPGGLFLVIMMGYWARRRTHNA